MWMWPWAAPGCCWNLAGSTGNCTALFWVSAEVSDGERGPGCPRGLALSQQQLQVFAELPRVRHCSLAPAWVVFPGAFPDSFCPLVPHPGATRGGGRRRILPRDPGNGSLQTRPAQAWWHPWGVRSSAGCHGSVTVAMERCHSCLHIPGLAQHNSLGFGPFSWALPGGCSLPTLPKSLPEAGSGVSKHSQV